MKLQTLALRLCAGRQTLDSDDFVMILEALIKEAEAPSVDKDGLPQITPLKTKEQALEAHKARIHPITPASLGLKKPLDDEARERIRTRYRQAKAEGGGRVPRGWLTDLAFEYGVDTTMIYNIVYTGSL